MSKLMSFAAVNAGTRPRFGYSIVTPVIERTGSTPFDLICGLLGAEPRRGTDFRSSFVYGCFGLLKMLSAESYSTVSPSFITKMSSAMSATTPMS